MKEIISTNVLVCTKFKLKNILDIYQASKQFNGSTYLYSQHKAVDSTNLPKLVSFLLTVETQTVLKIIIEGRDVQQHLDHIKEMCTTYISVLPFKSKANDYFHRNISNLIPRGDLK
jgi:phosphotransferase system HPr-like phosphotransfer protein